MLEPARRLLEAEYIDNELAVEGLEHLLLSEPALQTEHIIVGDVLVPLGLHVCEVEQQVLIRVNDEGLVVSLQVGADLVAVDVFDVSEEKCLLQDV